MCEMSTEEMLDVLKDFLRIAEQNMQDAEDHDSWVKFNRDRKALAWAIQKLEQYNEEN